MARIITWLSSFLPDRRRMLNRVWYDVDRRMADYVRGKFLEILIVWVVSYVTFSLLGLQFSMLLSLTAGLSVLIPYIGPLAAALPLALVAYFQWGFTPDFAWLMLAYTLIQLAAGSMLMPLLFSEAVKLHPIAIIAAILLFGGWWGFWGVFFAIPLATVIQAVLTAWPRFQRIEADKALDDSPQTAQL